MNIKLVQFHLKTLIFKINAFEARLKKTKLKALKFRKNPVFKQKLKIIVVAQSINLW